MTLQELLQIPHLKIAEYNRLVHLCAEDNYWITDYDSKTMKPNEYAATQCLYINILPEYNTFYTLTTEEHNARMQESENYVESTDEVDD